MEQTHNTIRIPTNVGHADRGFGTHPATILNVPSTLYTYYDPDVEYLPPDTEEIPHEWECIKRIDCVPCPTTNRDKSRIRQRTTDCEKRRPTGNAGSEKGYNNEAVSSAIVTVRRS